MRLFVIIHYTLSSIHSLIYPPILSVWFHTYSYSCNITGILILLYHTAYTQALNETLVLSYLAASTKTSAALHELTELYTRTYDNEMHNLGAGVRGYGEGEDRGPLRPHSLCSYPYTVLRSA